MFNFLIKAALLIVEAFVNMSGYIFSLIFILLILGLLSYCTYGSDGPPTRAEFEDLKSRVCLLEQKLKVGTCGSAMRKRER